MVRSAAAAARLQARTIPGVAVVIGGLLAASFTGAAVHRSHHATGLQPLASDRAAIGMPAGSALGQAEGTATAIANKAPTSSAAPAKTAPGDLVLTDRADGISLSMPAGWRSLPVQSTALATALRGITPSNPQLGTLLSQPEGYAATGFLRILAVHTGTPPMVVSVIATPAPAGVTLDQLAQTSLSSAAQGATQGVSVERVRLPAGDALQVSLKVPFAGQTLVLTQDLLIHNSKEVVVQLGVVTINPTDTVLNRVLGSLRLR